MAKGKGRRSSGANSTVADGGVAASDSKSTANAVPQLQEGAFAGLRQKIEQKLKEQKGPKQKKNAAGAKEVSTDSPTKPQEQASKPSPKRKVDDDKNKGKKRDRNGEVIAREEQKGKKDVSNSGKSKSSGGDKDDTLRQEILAMGGTDEDFDLLAGIETDSEEEESAGTSKKSTNKSDEAALRKELSSMLAAAGQVVPDDIADEDEAELDEDEGEDDDEEEGEGEDEDEDEDDEEEEEVSGEIEQDESSADQEDTSDEEEAPPAPVVKDTKKETKTGQASENIFPKEFAKLVRILFPLTIALTNTSTDCPSSVGLVHDGPPFHPIETSECLASPLGRSGIWSRRVALGERKQDVCGCASSFGLFFPQILHDYHVHRYPE